MNPVTWVWRQRHSMAFRITRALKYGCFTASATVSFAFPSAVIQSTFESLPWLAYVWSSLLLVGSIICLAGILTKTWVGEFIGLWGVNSALILYGMGAFLSSDVTGVRVVFGLLIFGVAASGAARHQDVTFQKRVAEWEQRLRDGRPGL